MASTTNTGGAPKLVRRFNFWSIVCHWLYAAFFIAALVTGLAFAYDWMAFLAGPASRLIHRIAAIGLVVVPVLYLVGSGKNAWMLLKEAVTWSRDDFQWLKMAIPYHFTGRPKPPPQGFLNAGQKMNVLVVTTTFLVFVVTGAILWFMRPELALEERGIFWWSSLLHSAAGWVAAAMFFVHVYLAGVHPFTRPSLRGMVDGHVTLDYALFEHPKWAEQFLPKKSAAD